MTGQVQSVRLIPPELVAEHIRDALAIVTELEITDELLEPAFVQACMMLAARATVIQQEQPFALPGGILGKVREGG